MPENYSDIFIRDIMTQDVVVVNEDVPIEDIFELFDKYHFNTHSRHYFNTKDQTAIGIKTNNPYSGKGFYDTKIFLLMPKEGNLYREKKQNHFQNNNRREKVDTRISRNPCEGYYG